MDLGLSKRQQKLATKAGKIVDLYERAILDLQKAFAVLHHQERELEMFRAAGLKVMNFDCIDAAMFRVQHFTAMAAIAFGHVVAVRPSAVKAYAVFGRPMEW